MRHLPRRLATATITLGLVLSACSTEAAVTDDASMEEAEDDADESTDDAMVSEGSSAVTAQGESGAQDMADAESAAPPSATSGVTGSDGESADIARPVDPQVRFEEAPPEVAPPGISPFVVTSEDSLSTFALDVDTSSWTQTMQWLENGQRPPRDIVRPEEFLNWFDYGYEQPDEGWRSSIDGVIATPWNPETSLLRIGLTTAGLDPDERPDATLTFVVDTSGSMQGTPLDTVKQALTLLVEQLRPTDRIGLVEYGSRARTILEPTRLGEAEVVLDAIDALQSNGSTNVGEGLQVGYDLARRNLTPGGIDVVVLASDGVANVGTTDADGILGLIDEGVESGIDLLALGVDEQGYNDDLMESLSNRGNGTTYYLRSPQDAERLFVDELEQTLVVAARDSKVQVAFDADTVRRYRLVGYDNRAVADEDFRNDAVDAGEVGVGHEVTAVYEVELVAGAAGNDVLGTLQLRWEDPFEGRVREAARDITVGELEPDAATGFGTAVQAVTLAEVLRGSPYVDVSLPSLAAFDDWGTSSEATDAIRMAAEALPAPGE